MCQSPFCTANQHQLHIPATRHPTSVIPFKCRPSCLFRPPFSFLLRCLPPRQQLSRSRLLFLHGQLQFLSVSSLLGNWRKWGGGACRSAPSAPQHGTVARHPLTCTRPVPVISLYCIINSGCVLLIYRWRALFLNLFWKVWMQPWRTLPR